MLASSKQETSYSESAEYNQQREMVDVNAQEIFQIMQMFNFLMKTPHAAGSNHFTGCNLHTI